MSVAITEQASGRGGTPLVAISSMSRGVSAISCCPAISVWPTRCRRSISRASPGERRHRRGRGSRARAAGATRRGSRLRPAPRRRRTLRPAPRPAAPRAARSARRTPRESARVDRDRRCGVNRRRTSTPRMISSTSARSSVAPERRADEIDLKETREIDLDGERLQPLRDAAVPRRFRAEPVARRAIRAMLPPAPAPAPQVRPRGRVVTGGSDGRAARSR